MAVVDHQPGPESGRLLAVLVNSEDHKELHGNSLVNNNGDPGGDGDPRVIIEMVSSTQTTLTDQLSAQDGQDTISTGDKGDNGGEDEDDAEGDGNLFRENICSRAVERVQRKVHTFLDNRKPLVWKLVKAFFLLAYIAYFSTSMALTFEDKGTKTLLGCTVAAMVIIGLKRIWVKFKHRCLCLADYTTGGTAGARRLRRGARWVLRVGVVLFMAIFLAMNVVKTNPENLRSLVGLVGFIVLLFLFSQNPARVNWHTVFWGIAIQWVLAVIILRTSFGLAAFEWVGDLVHQFLDFGLAGAEFVFGKDYFRHRVAMVTVSILLFFNAVICVLFHFGVIQGVINTFGRFLAFCLDTNAIESFAASSNIFISLTEAPMLLRPFLNHMTRSELHTVMTCGFASISGGILGTYVQFGIPANHLLTASVMSAPAALAISKLMCPETERSSLRHQDEKLGNMRYRNFLQAASLGAVQAVPIATSTLANQIAFVSLLAFLNAMLKWFGGRVGINFLTFKWVCSYIFYPLVFAMGTEPSDCRQVGSLLGVKLFGTPIMSYSALGAIRDNRLRLEEYRALYPNATWTWQEEDILLHFTNATLVGGVISERSEVIATYMLCGFSTITSIGVCLGVLLPLAMERKNEVIDLVVNALVAGNFASFLTAAIAGLMFSGKPLPT